MTAMRKVIAIATVMMKNKMTKEQIIAEYNKNILRLCLYFYDSDIELDNDCCDEVSASADLVQELYHRWINSRLETDRGVYLEADIEHRRLEQEAVAKEIADIHKYGRLTHVEAKGGEDMGSYATLVLYNEEHDFYIMSEGRYYSYSGSDSWKPFREAEQKEVIIKVYDYK